jgi:hypothetical protein
VQFLADVALNQQGDEGADRGVVELGCHGGQAFVYGVGVEPVVELLMDKLGDAVQVRGDLGSTIASVRLGRTGHAGNYSLTRRRRL